MTASEDPAVQRRPITSEGWAAGLPLLGFLAMSALAAADIVTDLRQGTTLGHVLLESTILLTGAFGAAFASWRLVLALREVRSESARAEELETRLATLRREAEGFRREARSLVVGLSEAIDREFDRWHLSPAEKEVALLLMKGLSHKDVAALRQVSEATARQQARAVYKKAGISGRTELSAFFLEDLMVPPTKQPGGAPSSSEPP